MSVASWDIVENEHKQKIVRLSVKEQGSSSTHESKVEIFLYGAHITKWQESNQTPFLFLSDKALTDGSKAIRGSCMHAHEMTTCEHKCVLGLFNVIK